MAAQISNQIKFSNWKKFIKFFQIFLGLLKKISDQIKCNIVDSKIPSNFLQIGFGFYKKYQIIPNQMSLLRKSLRISSNISFDLGRRNQIKSNQILLMRKFTSNFFKYFFDVWKQIKSKQIKFSSWENWVQSIQIYFPVQQNFSNQVKSDFVSQICFDKYKQINLIWFDLSIF